MHTHLSGRSDSSFRRTAPHRTAPHRTGGPGACSRARVCLCVRVCVKETGAPHRTTPQALSARRRPTALARCGRIDAYGSQYWLYSMLSFKARCALRCAALRVRCAALRVRRCADSNRKSPNESAKTNQSFGPAVPTICVTRRTRSCPCPLPFALCLVPFATLRWLWSTVGPSGLSTVTQMHAAE